MIPLSGRRTGRHRARHLVVAATAGLMLIGQAGRAQNDDKNDKDKKKGVTLVLKATPPISFSPAKVFVSAELKGGSSDNDEFYCPGLEWDWGDGTKSESTNDCPPYEAGKSTIEHRWSADGRMIAYVDVRLEGEDLLNDLWAIHSDGTGKIRVAEGLGLTVLPDYSVIGDPLERAGLITHRPIAGDDTPVTLVLRQRRLDHVPQPVRELATGLVARAREYRQARES